MTVTAYRICKAKYAKLPYDPFDGEGARRAGGRWNSPGRAAVYTAQSAALAAMEMLVHLGESEILMRYVLIPVEFPARLIRDIDPAGLPKKWWGDPAPPRLRRIGDEWIETAASAVLKVPSAVVQSECNYLLNPAHPSFRHLTIRPARSFRFDPRLKAAKKP
jgi:RES domain-containing protein